jgi:hypothetical protein
MIDAQPFVLERAAHASGDGSRAVVVVTILEQKESSSGVHATPDTSAG